MSIELVALTAADEKYAPPAKVVTVGVSGNIAFIAVEKLDENNEKRTTTSEYKLPPLRVDELIVALHAASMQRTADPGL